MRSHVLCKLYIPELFDELCDCITTGETLAFTLPQISHVLHALAVFHVPRRDVVTKMRQQLQTVLSVESVIPLPEVAADIVNAYGVLLTAGEPEVTVVLNRLLDVEPRSFRPEPVCFVIPCSSHNDTGGRPGAWEGGMGGGVWLDPVPT